MEGTERERGRALEEQVRRLEELLAREREAAAKLRELNRLLGEFVAVASHELRTPLTSILGFVKSLRQPQLSENAAAREEFAEAIERQAERLLRMVENLFAAHSLEERRIVSSLGRVSLEDVCREVVEAMGAEARRIRLDLEPGLPQLLTDHDLLARILTNLVDNALKYSPPDSPCDLIARSRDGSVAISVRDHGMGIAEEQRERIFEPYFQVDSSSVRQFRGAGIGLTVARGLAEQLGGTIEVESRPGEGSTFTVTLPIERHAAGDEPGVVLLDDAGEASRAVRRET